MSSSCADGDHGSASSSSTSTLESSCRHRKSTRRLLRSAVRDGDVLTLRRLLSDVDHHGVVNCALSDAVPCSALSYAARCGYPEIVDTLVDMPGCQIDGVDRTKRSALDEAIGGWAAAALDADGGRQQDCSTGKRCRIVRRLLAAGARSLSRPALDVVLSSALHDDDNGQQFTRKLVTVLCENGCDDVKSVLLSVLVCHSGSSDLMTSLLESGASPEISLRLSSVTMLPLDNAALMVRASGDPHLLTSVDLLTAVELDRTACGSELWPFYRRLVCLLTLAGHRIRLPGADWLRRRHAVVYRWTLTYWSNPRPLRHLARVVVRRAVTPNLLAAVPRLVQLPTLLRLLLLLGELG